ncbi:MAG: S-formylglutathione hydrolase [Pseudomonadota bacterium]|nr:S-formylglutathione hydrolase [Pseudomonadota bacterium]
MDTIDDLLSFGGRQKILRHHSDILSCEMNFAIFLPPSVKQTPCPVLWYLSGLTCTHANVMEKGEYRRVASELGIAIVCPDTSPRGDDVPDEPENWQFGSGAGFYLDASIPPYDKNYKMYSYIIEELPRLIKKEFSLDMKSQGIMGHSMGGHGAMIAALKNPGRFKSCSAFAPITQPSTAGWSKKAFEKYLGTDERVWRDYDAINLLEDGHRFTELLVDHGLGDQFLEEGLRPNLLEAACEKAGVPLDLRLREGYDHSYYFISTFMESHIRWHFERLKV